jgi:hypothetical protein
MNLQYRVSLAVLASLAPVALATSAALAQTPGYITSFEAAGSPTEVTNPSGYFSGQLFLQDNWVGGDRFPRVRTQAELEAELTEAGLNPANAVRTGDQALLVSKVDTNTETSPPGGYFVRNTFSGLETETKVTLDFWTRPLTSGVGADNLGTPGNNKTIGERQGNMFFGILDGDASERRAIALRFGVDTVGADPYSNVIERHIDFASASTGNPNAPWIKSGVNWAADTWYNFRVDMDFTTKTYDFMINGVQVNDAPIQFYNTGATNAVKFFVSRGTNQAGSIIDDIRIEATSQFPAITTNADFNADGEVDGEDFLLWQRGLGAATGAVLGDGDANGDGAVNGADLDVWRLASPGRVVPAVSAVPEPASVAIASLALVGLIAVGRQSRRA